jgi:hypothetical protein
VIRAGPVGRPLPGCFTAAWLASRSLLRGGVGGDFMDTAANSVRLRSTKGSGRAKPTLARFNDLIAWLDYLLPRQSALSAQQSDQAKEEIKKRLNARFSFGLPIVDRKTIASLFTEEELEESMLAPIKEMAAVEDYIQLALVEIREICPEKLRDEFMKQLFRREKSSDDYSDILKLVVARLSEMELEAAESSSVKGGATRKQKTSPRNTDMALEYVYRRKPNGSTVSNTVLMQRIGEDHQLSPTWSAEVVAKSLDRLGVQRPYGWDACRRFEEQNPDAWSVYRNSRDKPGNHAAALAHLKRQLKLV